ncbi:MAG: hypothetical protein QOE55_6945 [Acidobacteriaceae bacterium]|jgi:hypothetical protein|nr:hypothetical protein [Acidobacteriaceae bacterium]
MEERSSTWKNLLIISMSFGAGFALMAGLILGGLVWFKSRPATPKPWLNAVIVAKEEPGFLVTDDGKTIKLDYTLENTGSNDYRIDSPEGIEVMAQGRDGTLSGPLPNTGEHIRIPFFVPSKQKSIFELSVQLSEPWTRNSAQSDADYHEFVRTRLEQAYGHLAGFAIFDSANHYRIDLPKWLAKAPN